MMKPGRYSVWFKTPVGEGAGVVKLDANGKVAATPHLRMMGFGHKTASDSKLRWPLKEW
jgi:hypothetical protein